MAKLQIRKVGDEALRKVCRPVDAITPRILTLLDDMTQTMRIADGCGLAVHGKDPAGKIAKLKLVECLSLNKILKNNK